MFALDDINQDRNRLLSVMFDERRLSCFIIDFKKLDR